MRLGLKSMGLEDPYTEVLKSRFISFVALGELLNSPKPKFLQLYSKYKM